jgi:hypothetical protein
MWDFNEGDRVICIDAEGVFPGRFEPDLIEGNIYTLRKVHIVPFKDILLVCLKEIIGKNNDAGLEYAFRARRFAPIVNNEEGDDIAILNGMLKKIKSGDYDKSIDKEDNPYKVLTPVDV